MKHHTTTRSRSLGVAAVATALTVAVVGVASADSALPTFVGCLSSKGELSHVAFGAKSPTRPCTRQERVVTWNQTGSQGPKGDIGPQGAAGAQGPQGDTGPQGATGAPGPQGVRGAPGERGHPGLGGLPGAAGATGAKGDQGEKGDKGATGESGPQGAKGDTGATGPTGPIGPKGDKGDPGTAPAGTLHGYRRKTSTSYIGPDKIVVTNVSCDDNEVVISGGWDVDRDNEDYDIRMIDSFPTNDRTWQFVTRHYHQVFTVVRYSITCARVR